MKESVNVFHLISCMRCWDGTCCAEMFLVYILNLMLLYTRSFSSWCLKEHKLLSSGILCWHKINSGEQHFLLLQKWLYICSNALKLNDAPFRLLLINFFFFLDQCHHRDQIPADGWRSGSVERQRVPGCYRWPWRDVHLWNRQFAFRPKPRVWDVPWTIFTGIHTNIQEVSETFLRVTYGYH